MASLVSSSRQLTGLTASTSDRLAVLRAPAAGTLRRRFGRSQLPIASSPCLTSQHRRGLARTSAEAAATGEQMPSPSTVPEALQALGDEQRQVLAAEWGYEQLGAPLPAGITPAVLTRSIPLGVADIDIKRAALGMVAPLALMAAGYAWMWYMHTIIPGWQQAICWVLIGTGYFGLFNVAQDAARLALLPDDIELQTTLGSLLMAPSLYSLEAWRVTLLIHFNETNMLGESWQPLTKQQLASMSGLQRKWAQLTSTTPLKLLGSLSHWLASWGGFDLKRYFAPLRFDMVVSWSVPFWFMGLVWPALISVGGLGAWFDCWFMPWLVFHFWLSLFTLLQHSAPHVPFEEEKEHDLAQAIVNGTVTVSMPRWLEFITNNANYHLPQHVFAGIPFYRAREATEAMQKKLGPYMTFAQLNGKLLRNLIEKWQVYDEDRKTYITFKQATEEVDAARMVAGQPAPAAP